MRKIILFVSIAVLATGCAQESAPAGSGGNGCVLLSVDCGREKNGKASIDGWNYTDALDGESDIGSILYLVFRNGILETRRSTNSPEACRISGITSGVKTVYAYVNVDTERFRNIRTIAELDSIPITMEDNRITPGKGLTMQGSTQITVPSGQTPLEVSIPVSRHAARIMVAKVSNSLIAPLDTARIVLQRAFTAVPADTTVLSGVIFPKQAAYPMKPVYFIPGKALRLFIEAKADGITYYYPVDIGATSANTSYALDLTITRPGATSPGAESFATVQSGLFAVEDFREYGELLSVVF